MAKTVQTSGADENTPSRSEYFSWINNTNEGSTEKQTLVNLDFFRYLHKKFGMTLDIYAWDAGNLDGAGGSYEKLDGEKLSKQYPRGYKKVVERAKSIGTRMGVWGGPDGYGDTEEEIKARYNLLVNLCKDFNWALFKFDMVCGPLRKEMRQQFIKTFADCRKYSPDLILLCHRLDLGEADDVATTFLWEGMETYVDVHGYNTVTCPHNRAYMFFRGHTPQNRRLTEDHGVCISSSVDFFEDDLVYQAFNRCLILAPEIYGNPWLMRDDELAKLARVFNFHRRHRNTLTQGFALDESFGNNAFVRGNGSRRFVATGNAAWADKTILLPLDETLGVAKCPKVCVTVRFPYEQFVGTFEYGKQVSVTLPAFRAVLIEICDSRIADDALTNCKYEVLHETNGVVDKINMLSCDGEIRLVRKGETGKRVLKVAPMNLCLQSPQKLGSLAPTDLPENAEQLFETAYFFADNDNLELRSLRRSGKSNVKQVQKARKEFFSQPSYKLRGIDTSIPFDGNADTVFDTKSRKYEKGHRVNGGCLRVDFGKELRVDKVEIEFFDGLQNPPHVFGEQTVPPCAEISCDLQTWQHCPLVCVEDLGNYTLDYFDYYVDKPAQNHGLRKKAVFCGGNFRFFRLPQQPDRLFSVKAFLGGKEIPLQNPHLTNLFSSYDKMPTKAVLTNTFVVNNLPLHPYLAVAVEGETGCEAVSVVAKVDGELVAFPYRAPAYPANVFEYYVHPTKGNYTFYLPLKPSWQGKPIQIFASFAEKPVPTDVYLCDGNGKRVGVVKRISLQTGN